MLDIAIHPKLSDTRNGFIIDKALIFRDIEELLTARSIASVTKPSETGARNSGQRYCKLLKMSLTMAVFFIQAYRLLTRSRFYGLYT
jgi:hypothetical protein